MTGVVPQAQRGGAAVPAAESLPAGLPRYGKLDALFLGFIHFALIADALSWTFRISSGVSKAVYKPVVHSYGEFLRIVVGWGQ